MRKLTNKEKELAALIAAKAVATAGKSKAGKVILIIALIAAIAIGSLFFVLNNPEDNPNTNIDTPDSKDISSSEITYNPDYELSYQDLKYGLDKFDLSQVPEYSGSPYYVLNNNFPYFNPSLIEKVEFEQYSELDNLGRCDTAFAIIGKSLMPTEERGSIGSVKPSGWQTVKYDFVDGKYLYNRCHLLGYQLTAENANKCNLITGTRYLNVEGMLPFENEVAEYIKRTGNHVMYRVTPIFKGGHLLAKGVIMEAYSVEDNGYEISFNVFCYNVQPGVKIDYRYGDSEAN